LSNYFDVIAMFKQRRFDVSLLTYLSSITISDDYLYIIFSYLHSKTART